MTHAGKSHVAVRGGQGNTHVGKHYHGHYGWAALSVGIEAVFAARYGNLTGEGAWACDEDHRRFTLGALAVL